MPLKVTVTDAAGAAVPGASVIAGGTVGTTDRAGEARFAAPATVLAVSASHPDYLAESVTAQASGSGWVWENPVCTVTAKTPDVEARIRLSRLDAARILAVSNDELEKRPAFDPQAVFTWKDAAGNDTGRYLGMFNDVRKVACADHPLLPTSPGDGWDRLRHVQPREVDPSRRGRLCWLTWGGIGDGDPRLLVGAWVPRFAGPAPSQLDVIVFFSPTTTPDKGYPADRFPWRGPYPFQTTRDGQVRDKGPPALVQKYMILLYRYLFFEKYFAYQLLAARRSALILYPIQASGDWGPLAHASGLARLLVETFHFLHRTRQTGLFVTDGGEQDTAPRPGGRLGRPAIHPQPPVLRRLVLAGFSAGIGPVTSMLGAAASSELPDKRFRKELWGADSSSLLGAWKEAWDLDGAHFSVGGAPKSASVEARPNGWSTFEDAAVAWLRRDDARMLRSYRTEFTARWPGGVFDPTATGKLIQFAPAARRAARAGSSSAAERHEDARCSLVYFGSDYLHHTPVTKGADEPRFWSFTTDGDHHALPAVAFAHAASLSGLTRL